MVERRANVLLVDDEPANLVVLETVLRDLDANLVTAQSGEEALRRVLDEDFAVILMDVKMPGMNGFETASFIRRRERNQHTPLIFFASTLPEEIETFSGRELGAVDFLYKPIVPDIVRCKVSLHIALHRKDLEISTQWQKLRELEQKESERKLSELKQLWEAERLREAVRHERELAQTSALFRILVSQIRDYAILVIGLDGNIRTWSAAAERILGYKEEEIIGKHFSVFFTPEDIDANRPEEELTRARRDGKAEDSGWRVRRDGKRFWSDGVVTPLRDENGGILSFAEVLHDSTERKRWEDEVRSLTANLERSNSELEQFAAVASHDLQEPLRTISSYLKMLASRYRGQLDKEADEFIDFAVSASERMRRLIVSVLQYSKIVRNEAAFVLVNCADAVREVLKTLDVAIGESGAKVSVGNLPVIRGDPSQILQLFQNLIGNAIKYRRPDASPKIGIGADRGRQQWLISVSDNGIGIDPAFAKAVFEPFRRLHHGTRYAGSGIGLAVCKKIVELHGGRIWVESKKGEGATFRFTLPV